MNSTRWWICLPVMSMLLLPACSSGDSATSAPVSSAPSASAPAPSASVALSDLMVEWQLQTDPALSRVTALVNKSIDVGVASPYGLASYPAVAKPLDKAGQILAEIPESPDNGLASSYLYKASTQLQKAAAMAEEGDLVKSSRLSMLAADNLAESGAIVQEEIDDSTN